MKILAVFLGSLLAATVFVTVVVQSHAKFADTYVTLTALVLMGYGLWELIGRRRLTPFYRPVPPSYRAKGPRISSLLPGNGG